jgi:asparagine synthase (glutamine-hydrolysing)
VLFRSDVPLGVFLSGGVDSSIIAAMAKDVSGTNIMTFTVGFKDAGFDESKYAGAVSDYLKTNHTLITIGSADIIDALHSLPKVYDEPFADSSQLLEIVISKKSRAYVTVALTGDGGDESFVGYDRYLWLNRLGGLKKKLIKLVLVVVPTKQLIYMVRLFGGIFPKWFFFTDLEGKVERLKYLVNMDNSLQMYEWLNSYWRDPSQVVIGSKPIKRTIPRTKDLITSMALNDTLVGLPDDMLVKVDRATMSVGLEARVPLLDHRVIEYAWGLPLEYKLRKGITKILLRKVLSRYMPSKLTDRPKAGFGAPIGEWLRGPLKSWAEGLLDWEQINKDGFLNTDPIKNKWMQHLDGVHDCHKELWTVLIFQQWLNANREVLGLK